MLPSIVPGGQTERVQSRYRLTPEPMIYAQPCAEFVRQLKAHTRLTAREERAQEWLSDATARYRRFSALRQLREIKPRGRDLNQRQRSSSAPARAKHCATTQIHRRSEFRGVDVRFCRPLACPLWTGP